MYRSKRHVFVISRQLGNLHLSWVPPATVPGLGLPSLRLEGLEHGAAIFFRHDRKGLLLTVKVQRPVSLPPFLVLSDGQNAGTVFIQLAWSIR